VRQLRELGADDSECLLLQDRRFFVGNLPDNGPVNTEVAVDGEITEGTDLPPGHVRMPVRQVIRQGSASRRIQDLRVGQYLVSDHLVQGLDSVAVQAAELGADRPEECSMPLRIGPQGRALSSWRPARFGAISCLGLVVRFARFLEADATVDGRLDPCLCRIPSRKQQTI
jgi:hypothetical protein